MKLLEDIHSNWTMATEMQKLQARIWHQAGVENQKVILFSSPLRGEGKSTTVAHLGAMLALNPERRVLVADLDLRMPQQHTFFELDPSPGLAEVIRGECGLESAVQTTEVQGLDVLTAGKTESAPEILNSPALIDVFARLRSRYDLVIVDTPAMIPVADTSALMGIADGIILVVMSGSTPKTSLTKARELCIGMNLKILGLVVGNADEAAPEHYRSQYYRQYGSNGRERKP